MLMCAPPLSLPHPHPNQHPHPYTYPYPHPHPHPPTHKDLSAHPIDNAEVSSSSSSSSPVAHALAAPICVEAAEVVQVAVVEEEAAWR